MASRSDRYVQVKTVQDWLAKGFSNKTIHKLIEAKFDLKSYPARNKLIKECLEQIHSSVDVETIKKMHIEKLSGIVEEAMNNGKYSDAIRAIDVSNKALGIYVDRKEVKIDSDTFDIKFG